MLRVEIVAVGRHKDAWVKEGCAHFEKLLAKHATLTWRITPGVKSPGSLSPVEIREREAEELKRLIKPKGTVIALTDSGAQYRTDRFARFIDRERQASGSRLTFVIGGAYGLDDSILAMADRRVALSPLTFSHQLVRLVLLEQLYRALDIIHGGSYHK